MTTAHERLNLEFLVRMHRQLKLSLPDQLLAELEAHGIDPTKISDAPESDDPTSSLNPPQS